VRVIWWLICECGQCVVVVSGQCVVVSGQCVVVVSVVSVSLL